MKPVMFRRAYPLILGVLFLVAATSWAAGPDSRDGGGRATPGAVAEKRNLAVAPGKPAVPSETRVALVIGNSNYKSAPLKNPVNDARAIADKLQGLGFKVTLKLDQDQKSMADAIRVFGNQLKAGGAGLFYYAGHGMQVGGRNFLIPVDADIQNEDEVPYRSVDANEVLSKMETAKNRLNLMILDACRNNPFARKFRSASQGLAQMDAPSGTLVAFATAPGSVASDGSGKNGIYTQHLLASLGQPGVPVEQVFKRVRVGVMKDTRNAQVPWEASSLVGDFYFKPGSASATADPAAIELAYWDSIKDSSSADDYKAYLKKYPNGLFADIAKRRALNPPKPASSAVASIAPTTASKPEPSPDAVAGKVWKEPVTGMEFVWIPKGCFQMGSREYEQNRGPDERRHEVCVEGYWMGKYEVTNGQYMKFKPDHDANDKLPVVKGVSQQEALVFAQWLSDKIGHDANDKLPVTNVNWQDAMYFAQWLSDKTGKKFRLPTEAEWEYAARAGTSTAYFWGDSWGGRHKYLSDSIKIVGSHRPNAFGVYDMLGNVWEWTASSYDKNYGGGELKVAVLEVAGGRRVYRGGAWGEKPENVRSASRSNGELGDRYGGLLGFRLVRNP